MVHLAGEAIRGQPLGHRIRIDEGAVDAVRRGAQDTVKLDGIRGHGRSPRSSGIATKTLLLARTVEGDRFRHRQLGRNGHLG